MNVLLIVGLVVAILLFILFYMAIRRSNARACFALFIIAFALICGLIAVIVVPPHAEVWTISKIEGNEYTLIRNNEQDLVLNAADVSHVSYDYKVEGNVTVLRNILGIPTMYSPKDWVVPRRK